MGAEVGALEGASLEREMARGKDGKTEVERQQGSGQSRGKRGQRRAKTQSHGQQVVVTQKEIKREREREKMRGGGGEAEERPSKSGKNARVRCVYLVSCS